jgi:rhamnosyltransferase
MNRILFFVHYNKYNDVAGYVIYLLKNVRDIFNRIIFISNSFIDDSNYKLIISLCDKIMLRKNIGFDFGAWKDALLEETWGNLVQYDSITLINDSCFGPLFDLKTLYETMEASNVDFWGLTNHRSTKHGMPQTNGSISEHIQSYFICFNTEVVKSLVFQKFWNILKYFDDIENVIRFYETKLTLKLLNAGFKYSAFFNTVDIQNIKSPDMATYYPDVILKNKVPMLKIKSFIHFPVPGYIIDYLRNNTQYPISLITEHLDHIYEPGINISFYNKTIQIDTKSGLKDYPALKIAIHLHIYYTDLLKDYISYFNNFSFKYDLYITTDSAIKKQKIIHILNADLLNCNFKQIFVFDNIGRDILPWLKISDHLNSYDIVGHFHTKKTNYAEEWFGTTWFYEILEHLLSPISSIMKAFLDDQKLGVIIPEIPTCFHFRPQIYSEDFDNHIILNSLWRRMKCRKEIFFDKLLTLIMPYGNMFWYRPEALKQIYALNLSSTDFPNEPIANDGTILHCLERLIAYIAWENDFDFRIITKKYSYHNCFSDNKIFNSYIQDIKRSTTYRIGQKMLFVPKKIKLLTNLIIKATNKIKR